MQGAGRNVTGRLTRRAVAKFLALASLGVAAHGPTPIQASPLEALSGMLGLPQSPPAQFATHPDDQASAVGYGARPSALQQPHPAVARIVVPEGDATSYGSGTLIDVRDQFGLVITNWHVVRDGTGEVEVIFPDGYRSKARPLKVDSDWDLAALVIWRPDVEPVKIASVAPQPGEQLTICGYGTGQYRALTGRCTQYYSPARNLPEHMVALDVEARQGDSGGPIFNARGELAGVLFGAGEGTTLGSFAGQVESFLTTLAPDIGARTDERGVAHSSAPNPQGSLTSEPQPVSAILASANSARHGPTSPPTAEQHASPEKSSAVARWTTVESTASPRIESANAMTAAAAPSYQVANNASLTPTGMAATPPTSSSWLEQGRNLLAVIGAVAILLQLARAVR